MPIQLVSYGLLSRHSLTERKSMNATTHFQARAQQRAISQTMVELIFDLGETNHKGDLVLLGRKELDRALCNVKELWRNLDKMRSHGGGAVAFDGDTLITTFHRHKKFKRT